jgi:hypothetical protein
MDVSLTVPHDAASAPWDAEMGLLRARLPPETLPTAFTFDKLFGESVEMNNKSVHAFHHSVFQAVSGGTFLLLNATIGTLLVFCMAIAAAVVQLSVNYMVQPASIFLLSLWYPLTKGFSDFVIAPMCAAGSPLSDLHAMPRAFSLLAAPRCGDCLQGNCFGSLPLQHQDKGCGNHAGAEGTTLSCVSRYWSGAASHLVFST